MPLKGWVPSFHALVALCVSHETVIILVGLHWCARIVPVASVPPHSNFAMVGIGSRQSTCATIRVNAFAWQNAQ